ERRRLPRLPDDGRVHGLARGAVPDEGRLALVRDPDRRDVLAARAGPPERAPRRAQLTLPDLRRIVLHPARLRKVLGELVLVDRRHRPLAVEEDGPRGGGALVEREQEAAHTASPKSASTKSSASKSRRSSTDSPTPT